MTFHQFADAWHNWWLDNPLMILSVIAAAAVVIHFAGKAKSQ